MPKRRNQIELTPEEREEFLATGWTLQVASIGSDGWPHLVAMWFAVIDGDIHFTTFRKAQKVVNLRRDPKISCMLESGEQYQELRGLVIEGQAEVIDGDPDLVLQVMGAIERKRTGETTPAIPNEVQRKQATKRSVVRVRAERTYSWDHNKLGGVY